MIRSSRFRHRIPWLLGGALLLLGLTLAIQGGALKATEEQAPRDSAARSIGPRSARVEPWRPLFRGVHYAAAVAEKPRPVRAHAIRIDLKEPTIEFFVTPSNGARPLDTDGLRTGSFLKRHGCQVAMNASPFSPLVFTEGTPQDVLGLSISRGERYSPPVTSYGALLLGKDNAARIAMPPLDTAATHNAVGGFRLLLKHGENVGTDGKRHPRSAAGISKAGQYLYLVVIDGRQPGYSEGASTAETAEWMRRLGSHDALNLDGGGSTTLVVADGTGGARTLNRPIHGGIPGIQRINANHLGVFAKPLKGD